ncbi:MAG TPA: redoxin domain-containing protein [Verrucomicrobiae bacterium]|nr:redoxin domain-containing protein [Verrucomicrobiae bacterium]
MELEALQQSLPEIRSAGANLVAVSPLREPYLRQMADKNHLEFDLLSDPRNSVAAQFGLVFKFPPDLRDLYSSFGLDLARFNGDDSWTLPMPGRFIIDSRGVIRSVAVDPDYTVRPEPSETVAFLKSMR